MRSLSDDSSPHGGPESSPGFLSSIDLPSDHSSGTPSESPPESSSDSSRYPSLSPQIPSRSRKEWTSVSNTRNRLRDCLDNVHNGRFATSGALQNANNPGIFIPKLGVVGLPMSHRDAEAIMGTVHEDRDGADRPGSIDPPLSGSCELSPDQFELQNPLWPRTLTEAVEKTVKDFCITKQIKSLKTEIANLRICAPDDSMDDQQR